MERAVELNVEDYKGEKYCTRCKYRDDIWEVCVLKRCVRAIRSLVDAYEEEKDDQEQVLPGEWSYQELLDELQKANETNAELLGIIENKGLSVAPAYKEESEDK